MSVEGKARVPLQDAGLAQDRGRLEVRHELHGGAVQVRPRERRGHEQGPTEQHQDGASPGNHAATLPQELRDSPGPGRGRAIW